jgi:hypothetical protein
MESPDQERKTTDAVKMRHEQIIDDDAGNSVHGSAGPDAGVLEEFDLDDIEIIESKVFG